MADENVIAKNISMYSEHWQMVDRFSANHGFNNTSLALRLIVRDYERTQAENARLQQINQNLRLALLKLANGAGIETLADLEAVALSDPA